MAKYDVYGIGNALVDLEFEVSDDFLAKNALLKSQMTLVDDMRQSELTSLISGKTHKKQCGGSAANSLIAISQFGGSAFYSCKVAKDEMGDFYLSDLAENGVDTYYQLSTTPQGTTGKCMVFVTPDAERTMNTYLGITSSISTHELNFEAMKSSKYLFLEGYLVASETGQQAMLAALDFARSHGIKTALTFSDPSMIKFFRKNMDALLTEKMDLLFCNESEAMEYTGTMDLARCREELKKVAKTFVITLGKNGSLIYDGQMFIDIEPFAVKAVDSLGAGDMYAGAFLYAITNGHTYPSAGRLAGLASSKVVSQFGPRLNWTQAKDVLHECFGEK